MHHAVKQGHEECLKALIDAGGKLDIRDNAGQTCLQVAQGKCIDLLQSLSINDGRLLIVKNYLFCTFIMMMAVILS